MKKTVFFFLSLLLIIGFGSCGIGINKYKPVENPVQKRFSTVDIEALIQDSTLNVRALEVVDSIGFAYLTSNGELGAYYNKELNFPKELLEAFPVAITYDTITPNFRALAVTAEKGYGISIGSPALLFSLDVDVDKNKVVYQENHPKAFYDSMDFWNDQEGIAIGDPTDNCMSVIITRDGGNTWNKLSCDDLPQAKEGEAAFAASDTNISIVGENTWVATGGKASRILYSPDKGYTWQVFETPIIQGLETTGMYSIDFYDELNGFAIGGDYTKADANIKNKIRTTDGGKTWTVVSDGAGPGYRSCVQYVPNSQAKQLVAIGFKGIDYSSDAGNSWTHLSDEGFYTLRFLNDSVAYAAGNGRISKLTFK
ncbi:oxidoreductase [Olleya sp. YS]|uniref:WD40/YVTN/BNR-like repeat-containing protein n=1 Tax=Olleya sp. YS TaxID=3028318 RepID=UPI0024341543|nr:oxidoreductase [Olleya sp. YS]WGD34977.1 oxidoreductase [Olleya sp. YS]